jgi:hypothetical protein
VLQCAGNQRATGVNEDTVMNDQTQPPGITVYGQVAIDHIVDVNQLLRIGPLRDILRIGTDAELIFTPGSFLETEEAYIPWFFGPLKTYRKDESGGKFWVDEVARFGGHVMAMIQKGLVRQLGVPNKDLGGGGPNNIKLLYQVFANFPVQFIGTYRRKEEHSEADIWEFALGSMVSKDKLHLVPLHEHPPINICFEGVGPRMEDRIIVRSPFPPLPLDRLQGITWPDPEGSTIVVNTIYTVTLAVEALISATMKSKLAIIACTEALCSRRPFSEDEGRFFRDKYPTVNFSDIGSLYDLVLEYVLPNSSATLIMNESEIQHLTGAQVVQVVDNRARRYLGGVFDGLRKLRGLQGNKKGKILLTMGREGSLCLDEHDVLHHCGITDVLGPIAGKTAIGDVYAGTVIGNEHVKRIIRGEVVDVAIQMTAAAAAADVGVARGFRAVNVLGIDGGILRSWESYTKLGALDAVATKAEQLYGVLSDVRLEEVDWAKISTLRRAASKLTGPTLLEQDIGREWLRPPFANSIGGGE